MKKGELKGSSKKKWQVTYIAPLQPNILAAFLPWGGSLGAGRIRLAGAKLSLKLLRTKSSFTFLLNHLLLPDVQMHLPDDCTESSHGLM